MQYIMYFQQDMVEYRRTGLPVGSAAAKKAKVVPPKPKVEEEEEEDDDDDNDDDDDDDDDDEEEDEWATSVLTKIWLQEVLTNIQNS